MYQKTFYNMIRSIICFDVGIPRMSQNIYFSFQSQIKSGINRVNNSF